MRRGVAESGGVEVKGGGKGGKEARGRRRRGGGKGRFGVLPPPAARVGCAPAGRGQGVPRLQRPPAAGRGGEDGRGRPPPFCGWGWPGPGSAWGWVGGVPAQGREELGIFKVPSSPNRSLIVWFEHWQRQAQSSSTAPLNPPASCPAQLPAECWSGCSVTSKIGQGVLHPLHHLP